MNWEEYNDLNLSARWDCASIVSLHIFNSWLVSISSRNRGWSYVWVVDVHEISSSCTASSEFSRVNSPAIALKEPTLEVVDVSLIVCYGLRIFSAVVKTGVCVPNNCTDVNQVEVLIWGIKVNSWVAILISAQSFNLPVVRVSITMDDSPVFRSHWNVWLWDSCKKSTANFVPERVGFVFFWVFNSILDSSVTVLAPVSTVCFHSSFI